MPPDTNPTPQTEEELRAALGEEAPAAPETPTKFELKLESGEVFTGDSWEDVANKVGASKSPTSIALRDREQQIRDLKAELEKRQEAPPPAPADGNGFDNERFFDLWGNSPLDAIDYAIAYRLGVDPAQVASVLPYTRDVTMAAGANMQTALFHQEYPDFPGGDDAAKLMTDIMNEEGLDWTSRNLGSVYGRLVSQGKLQPRKAAEAPSAPESDIPPDVEGQPADLPTNELADIEALPTDELEKRLAKLGMFNANQ